MLRTLALSLLLAAAAFADPIRVLYLDPTGAEKMQVGPLAEAMREMGRDGIYFDYLPGAKKPDADFLKHYDVVLSRGDALTRESILAGVSTERRAAWQKFLDQREPEVREKNTLVANYEKRPEPLTFQKPFSVKGAMERTQVPADCRLEVFASEPEIGKPIAFAWDERGRLWLAETSDYPHGVSASGEGNDRIKICEDTDGDGRADKFTVFADKLNIPTGLVFARGGVIVSQPPRFVFLQDTNGDDKADAREVIVDAWGVRDTHAQASNLHYGYDNWLYGCVGYSGFERMVDGKKQQFAMGTYRFKADGSAVEFLHQFTNNAWAHGYNDAGDQFGGTANGAPIFFGGIPKTVVPAGVNVMTAKKINVVDLAHAITPNFRQVDVFGGYTSAAGSAFIYSANLPARMQGMAMVCEPTMKLVALMDVRADGAGWTALDGMNLFASSDEWTSPVYAEVGPDGAVWIADWQNFIIQHNPTPSVERGGFAATTGVGGAHENALRDHSRGRIYRVVWKDAKPVKKSLAGASTGDLVAALKDDVQYWRLMAQRLIVETKRTDGTDALKKLVTGNSGEVGAIHALWALHGLGALDEATLHSALLAKEARLRRNAVRSLGTDARSQALFFGAGVFADPDLATRLAAFVKLAEFATTPEIKTLVGKLSVDPAVRKDEWLSEAAKILGKKHGASAFADGPNLLTNGGLEQIDAKGLPLGWKRRDYGSKPGNAGAEWKIVADAHGGKNALRCVTRDDADTSFFQEVAIKPRTMYRLSGWVKTHALRGKVSFNDHIGRAETEQVKARESGWVEVETTFDSKERTRASINILHVAKGDGYFDDVKLCELLPTDAEPGKALVGDAKRGEKIFWEHPVAACKICHVLGGQGSTVGPALDGIASRKDAAYLIQSLLEPNAKLAEGFEKLGVSPMPPMGLILKPQEVEDVKAFVLSLK
ncbi:MAG: PVC-type heme-binding CxxCH protein [Chthoniobacteraceae bacterium]